MQKRGNNIDNLLRRRLAEAEVGTSSDDWSAIRDSLDAGKKKPAGWLAGRGKYLATLLFLMIGITVGYFLGIRQNGQNSPSSKTVSLNNINSTTHAKTSQNNTIQDKKGAEKRTTDPDNHPGQPGNGADKLKNSLPSMKTVQKNHTSSSSQQLPVNTHQLKTVETSRMKGEIMRRDAIPGWSPEINAETTTAGLGKETFHARNATTFSGSAQNGITSSGLDLTKQETDKPGMASPNRSVGKESQQSESEISAANNSRIANENHSTADAENSMSAAHDSSNSSTASGSTKADSAKKSLANDSMPAHAQAALADNSKKAISFLARNPISLSLNFAIDNNSHTLVANSAQADFTHQDYLGIRNNQEKAGFGYTAGAGLEFRPWNKLVLQLGINTRVFTEKLSYNFVNDKAPVQDSTGRIVGYITLNHPFITHYSHVNTYRYLSIPILIGYRQKLTSRFAVIARAGGCYVYLSSASGDIIRPDDLTLQSISDQKIIRASNISLYGSVQLEYALGRRFALAAGPVFQQAQRSIYNDNAPLSMKPGSTSFDFTVKFSPFNSK